jgi:hypothetical protein
MKLSAGMLPAVHQGSSVLHWFRLILWIGAVFLLPLTSLPLLIDLSGATTVAPPSGVLFLLLAVVWLAPHVLRRERLPLEAVPLVGFAAVLVISAAAAFFIEVPAWRDRSILSESVKALATFALGASVFFVTAGWLSSNHKYLPLTLRLLNWSGLLIIAWSLFQAWYAFGNSSIYPEWLIHLQKEFVGRSMPLFPYRVAGFTYEPSWLAHQLNLVYLPIWAAAAVTGISAHTRRWWIFTFERFLLLGGGVVLFLSFSRVGWISAMLAAVYLAFQANRKLIAWVRRRIEARVDTRPSLRKVLHLFLPVGMWLVSLGVYVLLAAGLINLGARVEPRLGRIVQENLLASESVFHAANKLQFAERVVYWATGWDTFGEQPILGVGPGNAGFFFYEKMPAFGWALTEVADTFYRFSPVPNTKSMWVRILAETGLIGFTVFLTWFFLLWHSGRLARASKNSLVRLSGFAGQLALIAFLIEGFSVDSFALPYLWFSTGLLSASAALARKEFLGKEDGPVKVFKTNK